MANFSIKKTIKKVNPAGPGCRKATPNPAGELGISTRHKSGALFMTHLNKSNLLVMCAQGLHDSVDTISRKPEYEFDAPINQSFDEHFACSHMDLRIRKISSFRMRVKVRPPSAHLQNDM